MAHINEQFLKLPGSYLFSDIAGKVAQYQAAYPERTLIRLGIGDVTRPLPQASLQAMHKAVDELGSTETFHGYGPEQGYRFLIDTIIENDFRPLGIRLEADEVFVSDGAKSDTGNFGDILHRKNRIALTDPIYPVYIDSNVMGGRTGELLADGHWSEVTYLPCTAENRFVPELPGQHVDLIYLCSPNNPTGTALTRAQLKKWVDYALENDTLILFDAAYEAFIRQNDIPHSIFEIEGADRCAVEFRSFSKTAGFTGVRCGYVVIPRNVTAQMPDGTRVRLNSVWNRRQCTKFNGTSYITQRGAQAIYTPEGKKQVRETIDYYLENARVIREGLTQAGLEAFGGENSPYIWLKTPAGTGSWAFFDHLLHKAGVVSTPGVGFGPCGEGYIRLTAFNTHENTQEAIERIKQVI